MRILMISPMYPSQEDPVYGTFIKTYVDGFTVLNKQGCTHLVCIRGRSYGLIQKVQKYMVFYLHIIYHLLFKKYDIVYVHTITTTILPLRLISIFKDINYVFNVHGADVITVKRVTECLRKISIPLLYKAQLIVAPSEYFKSVVIGMLPGLSEGSVYVSPSGGVDLETFKPNPTKRTVLTLGYVSRIDMGKGWDVFLGLIATLKREGIQVRGIIAGRGDEVAEMQQMVIDKDLSNEIDYVGPVPHSELPKLFNGFDVFIFPTLRNESLGLVGIEALACGVPVIGSNIAGLPGYIKDGINGYLFEPGNVDDLCLKVEQYTSLSNKDKTLMSENAKKIALFYDTNVVMKELYEKLEKFVSVT